MRFQAHVEFPFPEDEVEVPLSRCFVFAFVDVNFVFSRN